MNQLDQSLDSVEKKQSYYDSLELLSLKLQKRISKIITVLEFNPVTSNANLLKAINHFKKSKTEIVNDPPQEFLKNDEKEALYRENKLRISLYKILLFIHIADAIKSGKINLLYSYRYKSIDEYLVDQHTWEKDRDILLSAANLTRMSDLNSLLATFKTQLDE